MKANKLIFRALILLGFGGAVGLTGCSANRTQKSRQTPNSTETSSETAPAVDSTAQWGQRGDPIRVLYGVPPSQYNPDGGVRGERPRVFETRPPRPPRRTEGNTDDNAQ